jgi:hypothetical protein
MAMDGTGSGRPVEKSIKLASPNGIPNVLLL